MTDVKSKALNLGRLDHLKSVIDRDIAKGLYHGAAWCVARHGEIGAMEVLGYTDGARKAELALDSVFSLFSLTKAMTHTRVLKGIELGQFALTTKVSEVIPEFCGRGRDQVTLWHLMTHQTGMKPIFSPKPGMYIDHLDEMIAAICEVAELIGAPGDAVQYSPMMAHALMGEMLVRTDFEGRRYRDIITQDLFEPLGMSDTSIGVRADLRARKIVPDFSMTQMPIEHLGHSNIGPHGAFEEEASEMPWVGAVSTVADLHRFAEMLRQGGELEGARILSPHTLDLATTNQTGDKVNELFKMLFEANGREPAPAYMGLGFALRGAKVCHNQFGTLTSERTFGNYGAGSTVMWVDPVREMTFVCLTSGVMPEADNILRFQRLSDIVASSAI